MRGENWFSDGLQKEADVTHHVTQFWREIQKAAPRAGGKEEKSVSPPVRSWLHDVTTSITYGDIMQAAPHWRAYTFSFLPSCSGGCSLKNLNFPPKLADMMGDISLFLEAVTEPIFPPSPCYLILIKLPWPVTTEPKIMVCSLFYYSCLP